MISVIVPSFNRDTYLKDTVKALLKQVGVEFEILVIDQNFSPVAERDPDLSIVAQHPAITWLHCVGKGVVYGRNLGIHRAQGDIIVFVDDDVVIDDPHFLHKHLQAFGAPEEGIAAICGREINPGGPLTTETFSHPREKPLDDVLHFPRNYARRIRATILSTANCAIKKEALLAVGAFDESFSGASYGDDADLALRMTQNNLPIVYDPEPVLMHLMAPSGGLRLSTTNKAHTFNDSERVMSAIVFYFKHIQGKVDRRTHLAYIYRSILRKSLFLKRNLKQPWVLPRVFLQLIRTIPQAQRAVKNGHKLSFGNPSEHA